MSQRFFRPEARTTMPAFDQDGSSFDCQGNQGTRDALLV